MTCVFIPIVTTEAVMAVMSDRTRVANIVKLKSLSFGDTVPRSGASRARSARAQTAGGFGGAL